MAGESEGGADADLNKHPAQVCVIGFGGNRIWMGLDEYQAMLESFRQEDAYIAANRGGKAK